MRILQINCVYKQGSTGKIVDCIGGGLLDRGYDVLTCYGMGKPYYDEYSIKVCSDVEHRLNALFGRVTGIPYGGFFLSNHRIEKLIQSFRPDIVHVHCINGYMVNVYRLLGYLAKNHIKTVLTLHAEIFHTAGCSHAFECEKWKTQCFDCVSYKQAVGSWFFDRSKPSWKRMYDSVNGFCYDDLIITAVSPWLAERAKMSSIMKNYRIESVLNGLDISVFHRRDCIGLVDRSGFEKVVLFVTPVFSIDESDIKGGRYIFPISKALPNYKFIIVASTVLSDLESLPENVQFWGKAKSQEELAQLYSEADITLLLSRRETFSMVTAESLCCGTPVVGFKAGGPESFAPAEHVAFVEYANTDFLITELKKKSIQPTLRMKISDQCAKVFSFQVMTEGYLKVYNKLK